MQNGKEGHQSSNKDSYGPQKVSFTESLNTEWVYLQVIILSGFVALSNDSWWLFFGLSFGLFVLLSIEQTAKLVLLCLALIWGFVGLIIGKHFVGVGPHYIVGILFFFIFKNWNEEGMEYQKQKDEYEQYVKENRNK